MALAIAMLIVTSEMTLAAVALPAIGTDLSVGPAATSWVLLGYALPMSAVAIPAGRWADRADTRWVFTTSMTGAAVATVLAAIAPTFWILVTARLLQGLAAALTMAVYMPIVAASVRPDQRGRAIGYIVTVMTLGGMVGAPLGGLLTDAFGWRGLFLMKLPLVAAALWLGTRAISGNGNRLPVPDRFLLRDIAVMGGAVTAMLLAFEQIQDRPLVAAILGVAAIALAIIWVRFKSSRPLTSVIRRRTLGLPLLGLFLMSFTIGLIAFLLPYFVADEMHAGPATMGVALLFFTGAMVPVSPIAGSLADRFGAHRIAVIGGVFSLGGLTTLLTLNSDSTLLDLAWRLVLVGIGGGLFNGPVNTALMAATPPDKIGTAGGLFATVRTLATTVGPAVTALAWTLAGVGMTGFLTGATTLVVLYGAGIAALLAGGPRRSRAVVQAA